MIVDATVDGTVAATVSVTVSVTVDGIGIHIPQGRDEF